MSKEVKDNNDVQVIKTNFMRKVLIVLALLVSN